MGKFKKFGNHFFDFEKIDFYSLTIIRRTITLNLIVWLDNANIYELKEEITNFIIAANTKKIGEELGFAVYDHRFSTFVPGEIAFKYPRGSCLIRISFDPKIKENMSFVMKPEDLSFSLNILLKLGCKLFSKKKFLTQLVSKLTETTPYREFDDHITGHHQAAPEDYRNGIETIKAFLKKEKMYDEVLLLESYEI